jgi:hypothetical protein
MKYIVLFTSILIASGLLLTNIYNSVIDAKSWGNNIPNSIEIARHYFSKVNPGNFYRIISPVNQLVSLVVLILFWKLFPTLRLYFGVSLIFYICCDVLTFTYFYPRNEIMFNTASLSDIDLLKKVWFEWNFMNWIRSLLLLLGLITSFFATYKLINFNS